MLALDDAALARLMISATAMPADRRGRWLKDIAAQFEGRAAPTADAVRQRRHRRRKACGKSVLKTVHDTDVLIFALECLGELPRGEPHGHAAIEAALQRREKDWLDGWAALFETA